jgi:DNA polymerase-3 subunit gamma/tau
LSQIGVEKKKSEQPVESPSPEKQTVATATPSQRALPKISIKEALAAKPVTAEQPVSRQPDKQEDAEKPLADQNSPVTQEALTAAWASFAEKHKNETRYYSLLTANIPQLEGLKINFPVTNIFQETLQKIRPELLKYLCEQLQNSHMELFSVLLEKQESQKAYTAEDKFEEMSKKNQALLALKQRFMLDFE